MRVSDKLRRIEELEELLGKYKVEYTHHHNIEREIGDVPYVKLSNVYLEKIQEIQADIDKLKYGKDLDDFDYKGDEKVKQDTLQLTLNISGLIDKEQKDLIYDIANEINDRMIGILDISLNDKKIFQWDKGWIK